MEWKIAGAPGAWGVEDYKNPNNPPYQMVLDDASEAGYKGIELGPYGYLPQDVDILSDELQLRGLGIIAGTIYDDLVSSDNFEDVKKKTHTTCELISKLPKVKMVEGQRFETPYLVIIDAVNEERNTFAGHPDEAKRLSKEKWKELVAHIIEVSDIAKSYGIRAVIHPHAGGYIEFGDEIDQIMADISAEEAGLCLDTGHLYYSKMDPAEWIKKYADRLDYVHFKDINKNIYEEVISTHTGFFDGCEQGVMCPIGQGCVDYESVKDALTTIGYRGWITIEQERDPLLCEGSLEDARKSIQYLKEKGYKL